MKRELRKIFPIAIASGSDTTTCFKKRKSLHSVCGDWPLLRIIFRKKIRKVSPAVKALTCTKGGALYQKLCGSVFCAFLLLLFSSIPALAQEKKVLIIGIDGLMPEAVKLPEMPHVKSLYEDENGFLSYGYTEDLTFSGPSWSSILHGVHRDRHGVDSNQYHGHDYSDYPHVLMHLKHHNPDLNTAAFVTWSLLQNNFQKPDGVPVGVDQLVYHPRQEEGDRRVTEDLVELLETGNPGAVFYYQNDVDAAGHGYGFSIDIPEYREQLRITDERIGQVLEALKGRQRVTDGEEEWLIVLLTDHGGVDTGHSGNLYRQRFIPLIFSGASVGSDKPHVRSRNVDIARTVLSYMGVAETEQSDLDGHDILALARAGGPGIDYGKNLIFNGDGEFDRGFSDRQLDQAISGWRVQEHTGAKDGYHSMTLLKTSGEIKYIGPGGQVSEDPLSDNLFTGGSKGLSSKMTQRIDLDEIREDIESRSVFFNLSAYLGGSGSSEDRMELSVTFLDKDGDVIDTALLDPVTRQEREDETAVIYRETEGFVDPGTASVLVKLHAIGISGDGIDALADQLSFELVHRGGNE